MTRERRWLICLRWAFPTVAIGLMATAVYVTLASATQAQSRERLPALTIVHVADLPNLLAMNEDSNPDMRLRGGLARVAAVIDAEKAVSAHVLVTHGGNALSPSPFSLLDRGAHMIDVMNRIGFDVMAAGSHDFDFGPAVAQVRFSQARFPVLIANALDASGTPLAHTQETARFDFGALRVGIVGGVTREVTRVSRPGEMSVGDPVPAMADAARALRQDGAELVVALANLDAEEDRRLLDTGTVDLLLGGYDERQLLLRSGDSQLVETDRGGRTVAVIDVFVDRIEHEILPETGPHFALPGDADRDPEMLEQLLTRASVETETRVSFDVRMVDTINVEPETFTEIIARQHAASFYRQLGSAAGQSTVELDTRQDVVRTHETAFGNLVADIMREAGGADAAFLNSGAIRGDTVRPAGARLTLNTVFQELPFDNAVVVRRMTGGRLRAALLHGLTGDDFPDARFLQVSGIEVECTFEGAVRTVRAVRVAGEPLDTARTYTIATTDFLAEGGDGFEMLRPTFAPLDAPALPRLADLVADHLRARGEVAPRIDGRNTCRR